MKKAGDRSPAQQLALSLVLESANLARDDAGDAVCRVVVSCNRRSCLVSCVEVCTDTEEQNCCEDNDNSDYENHLYECETLL